MTFASLWQQYAENKSAKFIAFKTVTHIYVLKWFKLPQGSIVEYKEGELKLCHVKMNDLVGIQDYKFTKNSKTAICKSCAFRRRVIKEARR